MTIKEVNDILDAGGEKVDNELIDLVLYGEGNYDKAIAYIINLTGCEEEIAREIAQGIYSPESFERDKKSEVCIPKCPTCSSTHIERVGMFERWLTDYGCKPDTFVCKNCGYKW